MIRLYGLSFDAPRYAELADTCKALIWDIALQVLHTGVDVVLDWSQWSVGRRAEWNAKARAAGCSVVLHHLRTPVELASVRAKRRRAEGQHYTHPIDYENVMHMHSIFEAPTAAEGIPLHFIDEPTNKTRGTSR